jgi:hypothetical protein
MTHRTANMSPQIYARVAGLLYLLPFAPFGLIYVPSRLIVSGDATATSRNILANESLFRLGIASELLSQLIFILVVLLLYQVLKPANKHMAALMVIFSLIGTPIAMLDELNQLAILHLLHDPAAMAGLTADQAHALVSLLLNMHADGLIIVDLFWGLWLFPMGYLVFTSGFLPRIIGVLLVIGGASYLIQSFATILFPSFDVNLILYTDWGEAVFALWLVIRGVDIPGWETRALELARGGNVPGRGGDQASAA